MPKNTSPWHDLDASTAVGAALAKMESDLRLLKWMIGMNLGMTTAIVLVSVC